MKNLIEAIVNEAKRLVGHIDDLPGWADEALDMPSTDKLEEAIEAYRNHVKAERVAMRPEPSSVADVVARLIEDHDDWKVISADRTGGTWVLCDGTCTLRLRDDVCPMPGLKPRFPYGDAIAKFARVENPVSLASTRHTTLEQLEAWAASAVKFDDQAGYCGSANTCALIGGVLVGMPRFVAWVLNVARFDSGALLVKSNAEKRMVSVGGEGWEAVVMGLRVEASFVAPELLKENANG